MKIFFDGEFSGLDPIRNYLLTFCAILTDDDENEIDSFYGECRPEVINETTWDIEAQKIHKITPERAKGFPPTKETILRFMYFLQPHAKFGFNFVCHALPEKFFDPIRKQWSFPHIDYHFLYWAFRKLGWQYSFYKVFSDDRIESTITMAREHTGVHRGHNLKKWAGVIGFELEHHNAASDAKACLALYKYINERKQCLNLGNTNKERLI